MASAIGSGRTAAITERTAATADDDSLAERAGEDRGAFAQLYSRHFDRVYRYHLAHTGSAHSPSAKCRRRRKI